MTNWRLSEATPASSDNAIDYERWFREHPPRREALHRLFEAVVGRKASGDVSGQDGHEEAASGVDDQPAA